MLQRQNKLYRLHRYHYRGIKICIGCFVPVTQTKFFIFCYIDTVTEATQKYDGYIVTITLGAATMGAQKQKPWEKLQQEHESSRNKSSSHGSSHKRA